MHLLMTTLLLFFPFLAQSQVALNPYKRLERFAFGSCNNQNHSQPLWDEVLMLKPQFWLWGGDNIYADTKDVDVLRAKWQKQLQHPSYHKVRSQIPILGTWDDHDFAYDNATGVFAHKDVSQQLMLDFLGEPADSPRRRQTGVYTSYDLGTEGQKVKLILLDNRYHKTSKDLLGEAQWQWLEQELATSSAQVHIIMAGLAVNSSKIIKTEEWRDTPASFNRMMALMKKYHPPGLLFLSGDKHFASIFRKNGHLEFMSSGMTHVAPKVTWALMRRYFPNTFFGLNFGLVDILWDGPRPELVLSIQGRKGTVIKRHYELKDGKWQDKTAAFKFFRSRQRSLRADVHPPLLHL